MQKTCHIQSVLFQTYTENRIIEELQDSVSGIQVKNKKELNKNKIGHIHIVKSQLSVHQRTIFVHQLFCEPPKDIQSD